MTATAFNRLHEEARLEAAAILRWWADHLPDHANGGFYGEIDVDGQPVADAPKSAILNTRLLWFFSAMANPIGTSEAGSGEALKLAHRASTYIRKHFLDSEYGGIVWQLDHNGRVIDRKKQAYAQAFAIYGFAEYYRASGDADALHTAQGLRDLIERHFRDAGQGGYIEARNGDWRATDDHRLSAKDLDAPKTMNTHLHILEAYTSLYRVAPDAASEAALRRATQVFLDHFIDADGRHLRLFFDMDWTDRTHAVSFGHDIEASWLIREAVCALADEALMAQAQGAVLGLAQSALNHLLPHGGLAYERGFDGRLDPDGEWWGQAEGLVGFINAYQMTGDAAYAGAALRLWDFIKTDYRSCSGHEWSWYAARSDRPRQSLASLWKCPYHNGRAMIEIERRLNDVTMRRPQTTAIL